MARNGSGTFALLATVAPANTVSSSTTVNSVMDDIATALTDSVNKDGTKAWAANQSVGGFKFTSLGDGSARTDSHNIGQAQDGKLNWVAATGTDTIAATYAPAITTLVDGQICFFRASGANTVTTPTFAPNGLTARTIVKNGGSALAASDIPAAGYECAVRYLLASTRWELLNPAAASAASAATTTEQLTGTSTAVRSTPDSVAALWEAGADIADGAAITIGEGGYFNLITSTTAITSFSITTNKTGRTFRVRFDTARTLTHNATSLIIPGGANITTAQGDIAQIRSLGSGNVVVDWYTRASGLPVVNPTVSAITLLDTLTTTSGTTQSSAVLSASTYRKYYIEVEGVGFTANVALTVVISGNSGTNYGDVATISPASGAAASTLSGWFEIGGINTPLRWGPSMVGSIQTSSGIAGVTLATVVLGKAATGATGAVDRIQFSGGTFDEGTIRIYGVK